MTLTLPLEQMTNTDKVSLMESLWIDLSQQPEAVVSPPWHHDVLRRREKALEAGDEGVMDWSEAKRAIRESLS